MDIRAFISIGLGMLLTAGASAQCDLELAAADGEHGDNFGVDVAIDGDRAVVGAWQNSERAFFAGAAYVFERQGGDWVEVQKLMASDGESQDNFGQSVGISGATIIVGATGAEAAYVFEHDGAAFVETQKLVASDGNDFSNFGMRLDVEGTLAVIAAPAHDLTGAVYLFERNGGTWVEVNKPVIDDAQNFDNVGNSVDLDGSDLIVGITGLSVGRARAALLHRVGSTWVQNATLAPETPEAFDAFGWAVALDGARALVGAGGRDLDGIDDAGVVFAYRKSGTTWSEVQQITATNPVQFEGFGGSVALDGDLAIIGAGPGFDDNGSASAFHRTGDTWQAALRAPSDNPSFGSVSDLDGDYAIAGAPLFGNGFAEIIEVPASLQPYVFDPARSALELSITIPGLDPQLFTVHLSGAMDIWALRCLGTPTAMQLTSLTMAIEESFEVMLPEGGSFPFQNVSIDVLEPGPPVPLASDCCDQESGCCAVFADYLVEFAGGAPLAGGDWFEHIIMWCLLLFFNFAEPGEPLIALPVDFELAPDWGLGELNPTITATGDLTALAVAPCPADLDASGGVDFNDLLRILDAWENAGGPEDLDGNGVVGFGDLLIVLDAWGPCV